MAQTEIENPIYVHGIHPKPLNPNRLTIYVPAKHKKALAEISAALEKDGSSLSSFMLDQLLQWWEKHKPGNPQLGLEIFGEDLGPPPGFGVPGSIRYRDRGGEWRWAWLHELPYDRLQLVKKDGSLQWLVLSVEDGQGRLQNR